MLQLHRLGIGLDSPLRRRKWTNHHLKHLKLGCRSFHPTAKREILPLIGVALIAVVGRYSYKALQRMDEEYQDYLDEVEAYEEKFGPLTNNPATSSMSVGTLGVDLGTESIRIAYVSRGKKTEPRIIEDREGGRSTPAYIMLDYDNVSDANSLPHISALGRLAKGKFHERSLRTSISEKVLKPRILLQSNNKDAPIAIQSFIGSIISNALEKALGSKNISNGKLISGENNDSSYNIQTVFTYPNFLNLPHKADILEIYRHSLQQMFDEKSFERLSILPEAVSAVVAAEYFSLVPTVTQSKDHTLIVDIGAETLDISLVKGHQIVKSSCIPGIGGNLVIQAMANLLDESLKKNLRSNISLLESDGMARQRMFDAAESAVIELSKKTRTEVSLPFLTVDPKTFQPKHLHEGYSRAVVASVTNSLISKIMETELIDTEVKDYFSSSNPSPTALRDVISSVSMRIFEDEMINPFQLRSILVIGGGGRSFVYKDALKDAFSMLGGEQFANDILVFPPDEMVEELTVLGAAIYPRVTIN